MIEGIKIYPTNNFVVNSAQPTHPYKNTEPLLIGKAGKNTYQSLIQFDKPVMQSGAYIKTHLFLYLSKLSDPPCSLMIFPLWNKLDQGTISYYDFFYSAAKHVRFDIHPDRINHYLEIDISTLTSNPKETGSSFFGLLLSLEGPGIIRVDGANSKNIQSRPYLFIQGKESKVKKDKIKVRHEKILPSENGTFSKPVIINFKGITSFYVENKSPVEKIMVQIQTSLDGCSFFDEGSPVLVPPRHKIALSSEGLAKMIRLSVYGSLVSDPAEITSVFHSC
ncbi:MAG: hypothetical protein N2484_03205 [Clostridia bacterium]|nr:hypothetical protein [Clostridia bacterium]